MEDEDAAFKGKDVTSSHEGQKKDSRREMYEHKYFELDKKTGKERGRLMEHEESSDSSMGAAERRRMQPHERPSKKYRDRFDTSDDASYERYK